MEAPVSTSPPSSSSTAFPAPKGGASLILSFRLEHKTTLILGADSLAASRAFAALEADSKVLVLSKGGLKTACNEIRWRAEQGQLNVVDFDTLPGSSTTKQDSPDMDSKPVESFLNGLTGITVSLVCITDTVLGSPARRSRLSAERLYKVFRARGILVNTTDMPDLCDFSFPSTHRFENADTGETTPLQIGVTTNGQGCRLAGRIRREIVARLPREVGPAAEKIGRMRKWAKEKSINHDDPVEEEDSYNDSGVATPNRPVPTRSKSETAAENARRRMKWIAQISEYWPLSKLARLDDGQIRELLAGHQFSNEDKNSISLPSVHSLSVIPPPGRILLVGSGPGHPSLLTLATHSALTKHANLVLSDKLVPDAVLSLIPKDVEVRIARKFPGNAEGAQTEMMEAAVEAARQGLTVVRLKQGDPVVYGRAGEEVLYFRERGFEPIVVPGVSSALAGPTFAGIPVTQRGVAESFMVCTGVGRKGKEVQLPGYERGRTLVILMGVARLAQVIGALLEIPSDLSGSSLANGTQRRAGVAYPPHTPIALIERASMPDQRVIESTLENVVKALESVGEQRPPGMIIVGWSVLALWCKGDVEVLHDGAEIHDTERVKRWLGGPDWRVREGLDDDWEGL
ncbi:uroporphyrin-III C-methyltransferase [Dendrothele bispora CBS 962.96]|uniref:precorrin-2 dehydrogenase n=1 Tax=Dendrothele bispora (strain CBS 962.96) TaxID=1314807 RepID=A0A4S8L5P5_DENBC|nr:uroporphyrin-III C-methyltransferase [Dendrothele bispora CBS 962.96]